jgi:cell division septation protein DedD
MAAPVARGGWLKNAVSLLFLVVVGFFGGALFGILWEEPGLLLAHLGGETTEIAWTGREPETRSAAEDVAAPPASDVGERPAPAPRPSPPDEVAARPASSRTPPAPRPSIAPEPPPVAAAPPSVAIQVGAFGSAESAESLAKHLRAAGYPVYVTPGAKSGGARWRVRVGPVADRAEAESLADRLKRDEKLPTWILDEDG